MKQEYARILTNLESVDTRYETLEGKQYLVVPSVMMTPGVRTGSQGPKLYLAEELSKTPSAWNHKPVTIYHPLFDSEDGSACTPEVLEKQKIGLIMNTTYQSDKLRNENWLDEAKMGTTQEGALILDKINKKELVEVSTGLFYDPENVSGTDNGIAYNGIVRNIRGDHLAILLTEKGACSIEMGAGLMRNASGGELSYQAIREQLQNLMAGSFEYAYIGDVFPKYFIAEKGNKIYKIGYKIKDGKVSIVDTEPEVVRKLVTYVTNTGLVHTTSSEEQQAPSFISPITNADFMDTMQAACEGIEKPNDWAEYVLNLGDGFADFSKKDKRFHLPFTFENGSIILRGSPKEIITTTENPMSVKPLVNAILTDATQMFRDPAQQQNQSKTIVDSLIVGGHATEQERAYLQTLPPGELQTIQSFAAVRSNVTAPPAPAAVPAAVATLPAVAPAAVTAPAMNQAIQNAGQQLTEDQWLAMAPASVRQMVHNAKLQEKNARDKYISIITNKSPHFNPGWLQAQTSETLKAMAIIAHQSNPQQPVNNYAGQAGDVSMFINPGPTDGTVTNTSFDDEVLSLPIMDFSKVS